MNGFTSNPNVSLTTTIQVILKSFIIYTNVSIQNRYISNIFQFVRILKSKINIFCLVEEGFYYHPKQIEDNEKEECVICLEELKINDFVYSCPKCKKVVYHGICLARWINQKGTCPNCRGEIKLTPKLTDNRHPIVKLFNKIWSKGGSKKKT
uniref:RING-type domain-containing protein n=1 Tax=Meloidogyne enterolobii TaxID=390850 RepID=A0A6V7XGM4_MELEN|nr:unnamed protein product [Meloidogyne enterolobii]